VSDDDDETIEVMNGAYEWDLSDDRPLTPPPAERAAVWFAFAAVSAWIAHTDDLPGMWFAFALLLLLALINTRSAWGER